MPEPESHLKLSDREKALLIKWIDQGAEYKTHWAFFHRKPLQYRGKTKTKSSQPHR